MVFISNTLDQIITFNVLEDYIIKNKLINIVKLISNTTFELKTFIETTAMLLISNFPSGLYVHCTKAESETESVNAYLTNDKFCKWDRESVLWRIWLPGQICSVTVVSPSIYLFECAAKCEIVTQGCRVHETFEGTMLISTLLPTKTAQIRSIKKEVKQWLAIIVADLLLTECGY